VHRGFADPTACVDDWPATMPAAAVNECCVGAAAPRANHCTACYVTATPEERAPVKHAVHASVKTRAYYPGAREMMRTRARIEG
jgi:hypothetical protein